MAYLMFDRFQENGKKFVRHTGNYSLAGNKNGLLHKAWLLKGRPVDKGWHVCSDELIKIHSGEKQDISTRMLGIDWNPRSSNMIGIIELLDVYAYTHSNGSNGTEWTPLLLKTRDIFNHKGRRITENEKENFLKKIEEPTEQEYDSDTFLYLQGDSGSWNWGGVGRNAGVFIDEEARHYFKKYF